MLCSINITETNMTLYFPNEKNITIFIPDEINSTEYLFPKEMDRCGRDHMVVGFTSTCVISACHH